MFLFFGQVFVSASICDQVTNVTVSPSSSSDHCIISFALYVRGPGSWHCNVSNLAHKLLRDDIVDICSVFAVNADFSLS